jgi:transposase
MIEPELVRQLRELTARGWGAKRIAAELGIARNTVRRYVPGGDDAEVQVRRAARKLDDDARAEARQLFTTVAEGNAVVVTDELAKRGVDASVRTVQRVVRDQRQQKLAADVASVRFETAPGQQMQIDFGQSSCALPARSSVYTCWSPCCRLTAAARWPRRLAAATRQHYFNGQ